MNIFDTSAVLALLYEEEGRQVAASRLGDGAISTVNAAEVMGDYVASGRGDHAAARQVFEQLGLRSLAPDLDQASRAAKLRRPGLSLGDRFCLALGEALGDRIVTADQAWAAIPGLHTPLEMIR